MTRLHILAASLALATICTFWLSTVITELFLPHAAVIGLKTALPWGFLVLIPAMAAAGITGNKLARGRKGGLIGTKQKRMQLVAGNGLLVLVPSALFLAWRAGQDNLDTTFYAVQVLELVAGAANITLLGLNMRDGRKLTAGKRRARAARGDL